MSAAVASLQRRCATASFRHVSDRLQMNETASFFASKIRRAGGTALAIFSGNASEEIMGDWMTLFLDPIYSMVDLALDNPVAALVVTSALGLLVAASMFASN